jgi:heat shock protein HtpX
MNYFKTFLLMLGLMAFSLWMGLQFGGQQGMVMAFLFASLTNFLMYFFSDKMVLAMNHAQKVEKGDARELFAMVEDLAHKAGLPMPKVYVIEDSSPNAFATGRNPSHAAVAVTTGILEALDKRQLKAVLGHELTHVKNRDILIMTITATFAGMITMLSRFFMFFGGGDRENRNPLASLALVILGPLAAILIQMAISRSREYEADKGGAELTSPSEMISALKAIHKGVARDPMTDASPATAHMYIANPFSAKSAFSLFMTHPSLEQRVAALERL